MPRSDDLLFFGKVSAQVSHELKNILTIINEQAGLLADRTGRGLPLDPERLAMAVACLQRQVQRGDRLLAGFNRFAHAADLPRREVSLAEAAALAATLGARRAALARVALSAAAGDDARVVSDPFLLCRLLMACLERALDAPDDGRAVTVGAATGPGGPALVLTGLSPGAAPGQDEAALAETLGTRLILADGRLAIVWPGPA